jgi:hypothetical protein
MASGLQRGDCLALHIQLDAFVRKPLQMARPLARNHGTLTAIDNNGLAKFAPETRNYVVGGQARIRFSVLNAVDGARFGSWGKPDRMGNAVGKEMARMFSAPLLGPHTRKQQPNFSVTHPKLYALHGKEIVLANVDGVIRRLGLSQRGLDSETKCNTQLCWVCNGTDLQPPRFNREM